MAVTLGMTAWCPMMAGRKEQVIVVKNYYQAHYNKLIFHL